MPGANGSPQAPRLALHCGAATPLSSSCLWGLSPLASSSLGGHVCVSTLLAHSTGQVQRECPRSAGGAAALPTGQEEWSGDGATACRARVALAGPRLALVTNSHCCALCGYAAETQEKPALASNRAAGNRVGSELESRSLMPGLARASRDFSSNQASVMLEVPSSGRNRGGWPQRDGVQGSGGQPPPHSPCTDRASECSGSPGNNCPVHHLELLEEVWRGWWAWLGRAAPQWREGQGWGKEEASKPGLRTHGPPGGRPQPQGLDPRGIQLAGPCLP